MILEKFKEHLDGSVRFVFQPGEEVVAAGRDLIKEGILEDPKPMAALALHGWPGYPVRQLFPHRDQRSGDKSEIGCRKQWSSPTGHRIGPLLSISFFFYSFSKASISFLTPVPAGSAIILTCELPGRETSLGSITNMGTPSGA